MFEGIDYESEGFGALKMPKINVGKGIKKISKEVKRVATHPGNAIRSAVKTVKNNPLTIIPTIAVGRAVVGKKAFNAFTRKPWNFAKKAVGVKPAKAQTRQYTSVDTFGTTPRPSSQYYTKDELYTLVSADGDTSKKSLFNSYLVNFVPKKNQNVPSSLVAAAKYANGGSLMTAPDVLPGYTGGPSTYPSGQYYTDEERLDLAKIDGDIAKKQLFKEKLLAIPADQRFIPSVLVGTARLVAAKIESRGGMQQFSGLDDENMPTFKVVGLLSAAAIIAYVIFRKKIKR
jgi:hypothetical protein